MRTTLGALLIACWASVALHGEPAPASRPAPRRSAQPPSLTTAGTTWRLTCRGCPELTLTLWDDGEFWMRRGSRGPRAEIVHGRWVPGDTTPRSPTLALFVVPHEDSLTFLLERQGGALRVLRAGGPGSEGVTLPVTAARAASVDLIDDTTTFRGVWVGNVHDMRIWMDCQSGQDVIVESGLGLMPEDSAFALRGRYRHWVGEAPPLPPEWQRGDAPPRARPVVLQHAFVAERVVGGVDRKACPALTR